MKLTLAIEALELSLEKIKKTENPKRLAEANNLHQLVIAAKEGLEEGDVQFVSETIVEVSARIRDLIHFPDSAGKHDLI